MGFVGVGGRAVVDLSFVVAWGGGCCTDDEDSVCSRTVVSVTAAKGTPTISPPRVTHITNQSTSTSLTTDGCGRVASSLSALTITFSAGVVERMTKTGAESKPPGYHLWTAQPPP
jgi:hypothetical protein